MKLNGMGEGPRTQFQATSNLTTWLGSWGDFPNVACTALNVKTYLSHELMTDQHHQSADFTMLTTRRTVEGLLLPR